MPPTNGYCTLTELKSYIGDGVTGSSYDQLLNDGITAASRWIDGHCGRRFYLDTSTSTRTYYVADSRIVDVDDIATTTALAVKTDTGDDGTFATTISSGDYQLEPRGGIVDGATGWPFTRIRLVEGTTYPTSTRRPAVQVTATWGWAAVPEEVDRACRVLAHHYFAMRNAPHGVAGFGVEGFAVRAAAVPPQVLTLLARFRMAHRVAIAFA